MVSITNRFSSAYANSDSYSEKDKSKGIKRGDFVVDGYNYGKNWSNADQAKFDLYLKSLEFDNNVDLMNYVNEYNSPLAQAQRMREAGLNPDLQGINPDTASSVETSSPTSPTGSSYSDTFTKYSNVAKQFLEIIPQAITMYQSIRGGFNQLDMQELELTNTADLIAQREISKQANLFDLNNPHSIPALSYSHLPRRQQKRIEKQVSSYLDDFRTRDLARSFVYRSRYSGETSRQDYLNLLGKHGFSIDDDTFVKVIREFNDVLSHSQKSRASYDSSYYSAKDGDSLAKTENIEVDKRGKKAENDIYVDLVSRANKMIDSKDWKQQSAGVIMYLALMFMQSKAPVLGQ